jgi:membrane protein
MYDIARRFAAGEKPISTEQLGVFLSIPFTLVNEVTEVLQTAGFILPTAGTPTGWVPARTLDSLIVGDVLEALRQGGEESVVLDPNFNENPTLLTLIRRAEQAQRDSLNNQSFADLVG